MPGLLYEFYTSNQNAPAPKCWCLTPWACCQKPYPLRRCGFTWRRALITDSQYPRALVSAMAWPLRQYLPALWGRRTRWTGPYENSNNSERLASARLDTQGRSEKKTSQSWQRFYEEERGKCQWQEYWWQWPLIFNRTSSRSSLIPDGLR